MDSINKKYIQFQGPFTKGQELLAGEYKNYYIKNLKIYNTSEKDISFLINDNLEKISSKSFIEKENKYIYSFIFMNNLDEEYVTINCLIEKQGIF